MYKEMFNKTTQQMKIVYILKSFAMIAGTERVESDKMNYLAEHGFDVTLITYEQSNHPLAFSLHESIRHINIDACFYKLGQYRLPMRLWRFLSMHRRFKKELKKIMKELQPDIIVTSTYSMKLLKTILSVKGKAQTILESHVARFATEKANDYRHHYLLKTIARIYDHWAFKHIKNFDLFVALTQRDADEWRKFTSKTVVIPNPVTFYPDKIEQCNGKGKRIITVGRLDRQKGYDILVKAYSLFIKHCPDWHLDIYGSGIEERNLRNLITEHHLENHITINAPTRTIYEEYLNSDFYVLSSRYEGFPLVMLEAMSCGLPCVAFDCMYGPSEVIEAGKNGLLAKNSNIEDLAAKMTWMAKHTDERVHMGREARKRMAAYKKENIMQLWLNTFSSIKAGE